MSFLNELQALTAQSRETKLGQEQDSATEPNLQAMAKRAFEDAKTKCLGAAEEGKSTAEFVMAWYTKNKKFQQSSCSERSCIDDLANKLQQLLQSEGLTNTKFTVDYNNDRAGYSAKFTVQW